MPNSLIRRAPLAAWLFSLGVLGACGEQGASSRESLDVGQGDSDSGLDVGGEVVPVDVRGDGAVDVESSDGEPGDAEGSGDDVGEPDFNPFGGGCGPSQPCGGGSRCVDGACVIPCLADDECALGELCVDHACAALPCASEMDCRVGEACVETTCLSQRGRRCASATECGLRDACIAEHCVDSREVAARPQWRQVVDGVFSAHDATLLRAGVAGYGNGGALADIDGDTDLDVFLGGDNEGGARACLYRNESVPGVFRFERDERFCDVDLPLVASAFAVDVERDGIDELVVLGAGIVSLVRFEPEFEHTDLLAGLAADSPARGCFAGAGVATDLDRDGLIDLYIGCQIPFSDPPPWRAPGLDVAMANLVYLQSAEGSFALATDESWMPMQLSGISLAIGAVDVDHNGLIDLVVADDTFSGEGARRLDLYPGGVRLACAPTDECRFVTERLLAGAVGFGSFMGLAMVAAEAPATADQPGTDLLYVTDLGANRFVDLSSDPHRDFAREYDIALRGTREFPWYAWGVLVDDYDRNGTDDIFVAQGALDVWDLQPPGYEDSMVLQRGDGTFEIATGWVQDEAGLDVDLNGWRSRGAARGDLDRDGLLDLIVLSDSGVPRLYRELANDRLLPPRCTLLPRTRVVHTDGAAFRVAYTSDGRARARDIQGQTRFGQSSQIVVSEGRGHLIFPSGAEVYFDCDGGAGPLVVEEPDWIGVSAEAGLIVVSLHTPWLFDADPPLLAVETSEGVVEAQSVMGDDGLFRAPLPPGATRVMVQLDGRWVGRWWTL